MGTGANFLGSLTLTLSLREREYEPILQEAD